MVLAWLRTTRIRPITSAEEIAPTRIAHCWYLGVAPTRKPVFRSWDVVPPFEEATQTTAATVMAISRSSALVQPMARNKRHVNSSVATVMPEMGFDDDPISPVKREETVTNKNPKSTTSMAPSRLTPLKGVPNGKATQIAATNASVPMPTTRMGRSRSVRRATGAARTDPRRSRNPAASEATISGTARHKLMMPPVATAPAPIYNRYARRISLASMSRISLTPGYRAAVSPSPNRWIAGASTRYESMAPASITHETRVPMIYPTPSSMGLASSDSSAPRNHPRARLGISFQRRSPCMSTW
jgi:hypothetical protein